MLCYIFPIFAMFNSGSRNCKWKFDCLSPIYDQKYTAQIAFKLLGVQCHQKWRKTIYKLFRSYCGQSPSNLYHYCLFFSEQCCVPPESTVQQTPVFNSLGFLPVACHRLLKQWRQQEYFMLLNGLVWFPWQPICVLTWWTDVFLFYAVQ